MKYSLIDHIESQSEERIRYALQNLFTNAMKYGAAGIIPRDFIPFGRLEELAKHKSDKIRLWTYYVACYYCNDKIFDIAIKNILIETNPLIRSWMLATIKNYHVNTFNSIIGKDLGLPEATIEFIKHFFKEKNYQPVEKKSFLDKVIESDNMLDKRWLTMFYKYKPHMLSQKQSIIPIKYESFHLNIDRATV